MDFIVTAGRMKKKCTTQAEGGRWLRTWLANGTITQAQYDAGIITHKLFGIIEY